MFSRRLRQRSRRLGRRGDEEGFHHPSTLLRAGSDTEARRNLRQEAALGDGWRLLIEGRLSRHHPRDCDELVSFGLVTSDQAIGGDYGLGAIGVCLFVTSIMEKDHVAAANLG
jgi:hypothetical protein